MSQREAFNHILTVLNDAMLDEAKWPAASARIDEGLGTVGNTLVIGEGPKDDARILFSACHYRGERRADLEQDYLRNYYPWDERVPRIRKLPDGKLVHVTDLYTEAELKTSRTYNEFVLPSEGQNGMVTRMDGSDGLHMVWALYNPVKTGTWQSAQIETLQRLLPHLRHFVRVRQALAGAEAVAALHDLVLARTTIGVIELDDRARILQTNDRALRILRQGDGLSDRGGVLSARLAADDGRLQDLVAWALPARGRGVGGSMRVRRASGQRPYTLHVSPVHPTDFGVQRIAVLALVVEQEGAERIDPRAVASALGLTPAESRVAAALADGSRVRDIAAAMGIQESTVRWHVRRIFRKHGVNRQADLVRLVLSLQTLNPN